MIMINQLIFNWEILKFLKLWTYPSMLGLNQDIALHVFTSNMLFSIFFFLYDINCCFSESDFVKVYN